MIIKPVLLLNNALQSNNCPNLILYGDKHVGKNYELMKILNQSISEKNNKIITEKDIVKITNSLHKKSLTKHQTNNESGFKVHTSGYQGHKSGYQNLLFCWIKRGGEGT